jgi:hypothetical protein
VGGALEPHFKLKRFGAVAAPAAALVEPRVGVEGLGRVHVAPLARRPNEISLKNNYHALKYNFNQNNKE